MSQQYRYPGGKPFQTDESHVFYGRDDVSQDLYQFIRLETLVVLHAKSGLGKSSVINAGLMPKIKEAGEYQPFNIRFHAYTDGKKETPLEVTRNVVQHQSDLLNKIRPEGDDNLWYHLKSLQLSTDKDQGILLIFDQFEELFTYQDSTIKEFARQLSEALYSSLPQRYRDQRKAGFEKNDTFLTDEELARLDQPLNLRLLMAIRSDRMSLMKKIKEYFPTILSADFELQPLNREQAEDAILSPAYQKTGFITPIFDYQDDAIEFLLDFLSENKTEPIESFQLQILCEYVEQHLVENKGQLLIQKQDIANPDLILENYYLDKIKSITNPADRLAARRLIEEGFIFEDEERRLTLYEGQIFKSYGINQDLLNQLLDTHLIRSEPSLRGGYTYELSHDTLVVPVLKAKARRKEAERLVAEKEALAKQEAELVTLRKKEEAARQQAEKEKQLRTAAESNEKQARQRTRLAMFISVLAIVLAGVSWWLFKKAEVSQKISEDKTEEAVNAKKDAEGQKEIAISAQKATAIALDSAEIQTQLALDAKAETTQALKTAQEQTRLAKKSKAEAELAKNKAEAAATAAQNASLVLTIAKNNPTLAIRIAEYNLKTYPGNPAAAAAFREVMSDKDHNFYKEFQGHTDYVNAVAFSPGGKNILTGSSDKTAKLWDLSGQEVQNFQGHTSDVLAVAFSPDGKNILTESSDKTAKLWDLSGQEVQNFQGHMSSVSAVAFSPDGKNILTGSSDKTAKLWDLSGQEVQNFQGHMSYVNAVAFSPDGKNILTGSSDKTAKLWLLPQPFLDQKVHQFTLQELYDAGMQ